MIVRGSRYEGATLLKVKQANGVYRFAVYTDRRVAPTTIDYRNLTMVAGERLDTIAHRIYGNPSLWWVIARANPEILYPDDVAPGTVLRIPGVSTIR